MAISRAVLFFYFFFHGNFMAILLFGYVFMVLIVFHLLLRNIGEEYLYFLRVVSGRLAEAPPPVPHTLTNIQAAGVSLSVRL